MAEKYRKLIIVRRDGVVVSDTATSVARDIVGSGIGYYVVSGYFFSESKVGHWSQAMKIGIVFQRGGGHLLRACRGRFEPESSSLIYHSPPSSPHLEGGVKYISRRLYNRQSLLNSRAEILLVE